MDTIVDWEPRGIRVILNRPDVTFSIVVGDKRQDTQGVGTDYRQLSLTPEQSRALWRTGALSECATARGLVIEWNGDITGDVGPYEVKFVRYNSHRLFIPTAGRHREPKQIYISTLCLTHPYEWLVRGWVYAGELMKDEYLSYMNNEDRQKVWVLPNRLLRPMATLKDAREIWKSLNITAAS